LIFKFLEKNKSKNSIIEPENKLPPRKGIITVPKKSTNKKKTCNISKIYWTNDILREDFKIDFTEPKKVITGIKSTKKSNPTNLIKFYNETPYKIDIIKNDRQFEYYKKFFGEFTKDKYLELLKQTYKKLNVDFSRRGLVVVNKDFGIKKDPYIVTNQQAFTNKMTAIKNNTKISTEIKA